MFGSIITSIIISINRELISKSLKGGRRVKVQDEIKIIKNNLADDNNMTRELLLDISERVDKYILEYLQEREEE